MLGASEDHLALSSIGDASTHAQDHVCSSVERLQLTGAIKSFLVLWK